MSFVKLVVEMNGNKFLVSAKADETVEDLRKRISSANQQLYKVSTDPSTFQLKYKNEIDVPLNAIVGQIFESDATVQVITSSTVILDNNVFIQGKNSNYWKEVTLPFNFKTRRFDCSALQNVAVR
jgi:hypothetical protein